MLLSFNTIKQQLCSFNLFGWCKNMSHSNIFYINNNTYIVHYLLDLVWARKRTSSAVVMLAEDDALNIYKPIYKFFFNLWLIQQRTSSGFVYKTKQTCEVITPTSFWSRQKTIGLLRTSREIEPITHLNFPTVRSKTWWEFL